MVYFQTVNKNIPLFQIFRDYCHEMKPQLAQILSEVLSLSSNVPKADSELQES